MTGARLEPGPYRNSWTTSILGSLHESDFRVRQMRTKRADVSGFPSVNQIVRIPAGWRGCRTSQGLTVSA
jgi:hypothetical protein